MTIEEMYKKLNGILKITEQYENELKLFEEAQTKLKNAKVFVPDRLKKYDEANKQKFIIDKAGKEPEPPAKWNPLNHTKKKKELFKKVYLLYEEKRNAAEQQYYEMNKATRLSLEKMDEDEKHQKIAQAHLELEVMNDKLKYAKKKWEEEKTLSDRLRKTDVIKKMLSFIEDRRVDSMKEVINLYYDEERKDTEARLAEEHRKRMDKVLENLSRKIDDIEEEMENTYTMAEDACYRVEEAYNRAEVAYNKAEDAYNKAEDAYRKAEDASSTSYMI